MLLHNVEVLPHMLDPCLRLIKGTPTWFYAWPRRLLQENSTVDLDCSIKPWFGIIMIIVASLT
jgi:hypothetical protein